MIRKTLSILLATLVASAPILCCCALSGGQVSPSVHESTLIPVLTSTGRGSDIMVPMAIPSFGGMAVVLVTIYVVPVLYCGVKEITYNLRRDA